MKKEKIGNKSGYRGFSLSISLIEEIKGQIKEDPEFSSVADFIREAAREKLDSLIIGQELTPVEKIIFRDSMRQKRLEALKEATSFLERERTLKESIKETKQKKKNKQSKGSLPDYDVNVDEWELKELQEKKKQRVEDIKKKNMLNGNGHGLK